MIIAILSLPLDLFFNPFQTLGWTVIRLYQFFLSDIQPDVCNFRNDISCSKFGRKAVERYGIWGILMASDRLQRCNPGSWKFAGTIYGVDKGKLVDSLELFSPKAEEIPRMLLR
jgi:Uncharacterized conserved protein